MACLSVNRKSENMHPSNLHLSQAKSMKNNSQSRQATQGVRQRLTRLGVPETFRLTMDMPWERHKLRRVLPFNRSLPVIIILAAIDVAVMIPEVSTFDRVMQSWQAMDSLANLTGAVFMTAWLLGWSVAPLILTLILLLLLTGREVLIGRPGVLQIGIGLPGLMFAANFDVRKVTNLRLADSESKPGTAWRGTYIAFDYGDHQFEFGSGMTQHDLSTIKGEIERATQGVAEMAVEKTALHDAPSQETSRFSKPTDFSGHAEKPVTLASPSTLALIVSNFLPVIGALYFNWRLGDIMVLYWAESAVIAIFNVAKMVYINKWMGAISGLFFLSHFSGFMAVHFLFIYGLFIEGLHHTTDGSLKAVAGLFISLWPALLALFISHGISFATNFVGQREYERITLQQQMKAPYRRIVLMQVTLILGGFIIALLDDPLPVILLFILAKIIMDTRAHLKEHEGKVSETALAKEY